MKKIKFAILGCGRIAERHAIHASKQGELVAVCDIVPEKAKAFASNYQAIPFHSIEAVLAADLSIDVVVICTPNALHAAQSIAVLEAGYHVLVEKPMAISSADCKAMMLAAEKTGKQIFTVKQNRFNPPVAVVKKAIDEGRTGKIFSFQLTCFWNRPAAYYKNSWHGTALDGGVLFTQFSHFIDLLFWLFGDVKDLKAIAKNFAHQGLLQGEDSGVVIMEMQSGAIGTINYSVNSAEKNAEGSLTIIAEKTTLKIGGEYLNTIAYQTGEKIQLSDSEFVQPPNDYGSYQGSMSNHHKVYESLVKFLLEQIPYYATAAEGMKAVEIIERIYQSAKNGNHAISTEKS